MRHIKGRLTSLKNKINELLPEGSDIFEFPGISKNLIIESIDETYQTLDLLSEYENKFETVLLQRRIALSIDKAVDFLKEKYKNKNTEEFNSFLNKIADIHYATKETYVILTKDPIRLDISIQKAKERLEELEYQNNQIQPIVKSLEDSYSKTNTIVEALNNQNNESITKLEEAKYTLHAAISLKKKADSSSNNITKIEQELNSTKSEITNYQDQIIDLSKKLQLEYDLLMKNKIEFEKSLTELQLSIHENEKHQVSIQETIENANRLGMAGSFKRRKDELSTPYWAWGIATILTICILIYSSYNVFTILKDKPFSYDYLLVRIPIFASFVWLGWFCAKQFGFVSRIREDYSYKYAVSMAFEGYKNATKEINEEMLESLLTLTLQNISSNPLNIFETGSNHGTPINEILSNWTKKGIVKIKKDTKNNLEEVEIHNQVEREE